MKYLSALLTQASGSLGGATASTNRGGNYFRARVAPVQPRSEAQQAVRSRLSALSSQWRTLTPSQIAGWNSLASSVTLHDSLGNSYKPTGAQLFTGNNCNLSDIGEAYITDAPSAPPTLPDITPLAATFGDPGTTFAITTGLTAAPTGVRFLARATKPLSAGISYVGQSQFRLCGHYLPAAYASIDIHLAYEALFGWPTPTATVAVSIETVDTATGFKSIAATTFATSL